MKFGKQILAASETSASVCSEDMWLDYKRLKKLIKAIPDSVREASRLTASEEQKRALSGSEDERKFFLLLRKELKKVAKCFKDLEYQTLRSLVDLKARCARQVHAAESDKGYDGDTEAQHVLLRACTDMHMRLLMLENYAVLNYAGFTKILKKHDKMTGFRTKDQFLLKMVNSQPFVVHPWLRNAIHSVEDQFRIVRALTAPTEDVIQASEGTSPAAAAPSSASTSAAADPESSSSSSSSSNNNPATVAVANGMPGSAALLALHPRGSSNNDPNSTSTSPTGGIGRLAEAASSVKAAAEAAHSAASPSETSAQAFGRNSHSLQPINLRMPGLSVGGVSRSSSLLNHSAQPEFHRLLLQLHATLEQSTGSGSWLRNAFDRANLYQNMPSSLGGSAIGANSSSLASSSAVAAALASAVASANNSVAQHPQTSFFLQQQQQQDRQVQQNRRQQQQQQQAAEQEPFSLTRTLDTLAMLAQQAQFASTTGSSSSNSSSSSNNKKRPADAKNGTSRSGGTSSKRQRKKK